MVPFAATRYTVPSNREDDVEMAGAIEGQAGGVHHVVEERPDGVVGIDLVDRDGNLLASRPGEGDVRLPSASMAGLVTG